MNAKHTPGPWLFAMHGKNWPSVVTADGTLLARTYNDPHAVADAHLLKAAPEQHELLCEVLTLLDTCLDGRPHIESLRSRVRAAIAKATGEGK